MYRIGKVETIQARLQQRKNQNRKGGKAEKENKGKFSDVLNIEIGKLKEKFG